MVTDSNKQKELKNDFTNQNKSREILKKRAIELFDLKDDPFYIRLDNKFKCKLCLTMHRSESSYLAHTQGKRHNKNIKKRNLAVDNKNIIQTDHSFFDNQRNLSKPAYKVTKAYCKITHKKIIFIEVIYEYNLPEDVPDYRILTTYEQSIEKPDNNYQYLLVASPNYVTICFKIPNLLIDYENQFTYSYW
mmetsp:Transcript_34292/g.55179  ORF Transcript_34292/g.55179 Transcript_34292/m.55179 type:complete len:190 (+) Transcript_34292:45-614(+)